MQFEQGERDLVVSTVSALKAVSKDFLIQSIKMLQHKFEIEYNDGKKETRTSTLCEYGAPIGSGGYSAMAKLVGVPCGVGKSPRVLELRSAL